MKVVRVEIGSYSGDREICEISFYQNILVYVEFKSEKFGILSLSGDSLFDVICELRIKLEREGYFLLCNVSRKNAYPSRMARQMGGGVYLLKSGVQARKSDLVDFFGFAEMGEIGSVAEQRANFDAWITSLGK